MTVSVFLRLEVLQRGRGELASQRIYTFVRDGWSRSEWCTPQSPSICIPEVVREHGDSKHEWQCMGEWVVPEGRTEELEGEE